MTPLQTLALTATMLAASNLFMTFAWYGHLKHLQSSPWWIAALVSWGIALFEYLLQVPANRIGFAGGIDARAAEDRAGGDHARRLRSLRDALHGRGAQVELPVGGAVPRGRGLLHLPGLMRLHILGICGTFMGGLAKIAREAGHEVTGCDAQVYPPMSEQLRDLGIALHEGYDAEQLERYPADLYVVGNAMTRGKPVVEEILDRGLPYASGPQWLAEHVLPGKWVLAVAGTHGKTTTSAMLAWILANAGLDPGFLIGGVPRNFHVSALLTDSPFFVIEADEYDTAFFDKRSKFVWYRPRTAVLNNLEFDHADIFPDLAAIETQFHHLVRIVPANGLRGGQRRRGLDRPRARARLLDERGALRRRARRGASGVGEPGRFVRGAC